MTAGTRYRLPIGPAPAIGLWSAAVAVAPTVWMKLVPMAAIASLVAWGPTGGRQDRLPHVL
jgi:hypothetical protein